MFEVGADRLRGCTALRESPMSQRGGGFRLFPATSRPTYLIVTVTFPSAAPRERGSCTSRTPWCSCGASAATVCSPSSNGSPNNFPRALAFAQRPARGGDLVLQRLSRHGL